VSAIVQSADAIVTTLQVYASPNDYKSIDIPGSLVYELVESAQTIILCAQHQKRIVDDILTLSKLDASLLVISPDDCEPPALVDKALRMYSDEIERADITAEIVLEHTYKELRVSKVMMDSSRFLQVVINLLTNAIKFLNSANVRKLSIHVGASYTRPTGAHHGVRFVPTRRERPDQVFGPEWGSGEDLYLQVAVVDTGSGINDDEMKLLFERFAQASPKTYKQYGGSGLGLFISRELCELQGGQIGVCSANGRTAFTFYVRVKRFTTETHKDRPRLARYVSASASPVAFTRRGSSVLGVNLEPEPVQTNGGAEVPQEDRAAMHPTTNGKPHVADMTIPATINGQAKHVHVLLVEDNFINQKVMSQQLRKAGLTVHVANHGLECLDFVSRSSFCSLRNSPGSETAVVEQDPTPLSIILLDLEMPTMDGLTCIRHIRERQLNGQIASHIPVIAVTANARNEQIANAIEAGMDQVVTKPFRIPELLPQMHSLIAEITTRSVG
jgi:CheY-like chemotaxis protein